MNTIQKIQLIPKKSVLALHATHLLGYPLVLIVLLSISTCQKPEVANPADPNYELAPPTLLTAEAVSDVSIELTWKDNEEHTREFVISRKSGSGSFVVIAAVEKSHLSYTDTSCQLGINYSYAVQAKVGENLSNNSNTLQKATSFSAPSGLTSSSISDNELLLSWTDNTGYEEGFKIERDSGSGFAEIGTVGANVTEYTDTGLTYGQSYEYRVAAYTAAITSGYSEIASVTVAASMVDFDGNIYATIQIGDQIWMAENLRVTHYRDGTPIANLTADGDWTSTSSGAYCYYDNDSGNGEIYGALYNWYAATDSRNIAPEGWHVPTDAEWKELEMTLGMNQSEVDGTGYRGTNEGSMLAGNADLWNSGVLENDAEFGASGFAALPAGCRYYYDGYFYGMGGDAYFWSATESSSNYPWYRKLNYNSSDVNRNYGSKSYGFCIRLLRD